jgi:hypothetical protein
MVAKLIEAAGGDAQAVRLGVEAEIDKMPKAMLRQRRSTYL